MKDEKSNTKNGTIVNNNTLNKMNTVQLLILLFLVPQTFAEMGDTIKLNIPYDKQYYETIKFTSPKIINLDKSLENNLSACSFVIVVSLPPSPETFINSPLPKSI